MTIQTGDIKILASKVMDDVPEGGGGPSGTVIPDNQSNAVVPDVSEVDRAGGAVNIRQLHAHVQTTDVDRFLGAHIIISKVPDDANVAITLAGCSPFDRRTDIATAIENYLIQGPEWSGHLFENHVQGQRNMQLFQRPGTPPPTIGRTLVLIKNEGLINEYKQYVRVTSVESEIRTFTYLLNATYVDYEGQIVTCDLSDSLREAFPGSPANRTFSKESGKTVVRDTTVADAATYYGAVPLSSAATLSDMKVTVSSIYSQLVPSSRTETTALDQKPAAQRTLTLATTPRLVEVGITPHSLRIRVGQENRGFSWVQLLRPYPAPGTVVISFMALGNWYTVYDDGEGNLTGSGTGTINYLTGSIAVTFPSMPDAGSSILFQWGESTAFTSRNGVVGYRLPEFSWEVATFPVKPGSVTITWQSGGNACLVTDNGTGLLSGSGTGTINYATGQITLQPQYMLDAGGEFHTQYTYSPMVTEWIQSVVTDAGGFAQLNLSQVPAPRSLSLKWTTVRNVSSTSGSTEVVTNSTTTAGVGPTGVSGGRGGRSVNTISFYSPTTASTSGFPPGAVVQAKVALPTQGDYTWRIQNVRVSGTGAAAMPADIVVGPSTGTVEVRYPAGIVAGYAIGTIPLTTASATQSYVAELVVEDSGSVAVATSILTLQADPGILSQVPPPMPATIARTPTAGTVAGPQPFPGGFYNSDDGTILGQRVQVQVDPLYDTTYGFSYDPPNGQASWSDAEFITAKQKTMLSQRGVLTTYKLWGV